MESERSEEWGKRHKLSAASIQLSDGGGVNLSRDNQRLHSLQIDPSPIFGTAHYAGAWCPSEAGLVDVLA